MVDKRPDAPDRKLARLWQAYLWWEELMLMQQRHVLRIKTAERGKSKMDIMFERDRLDQVLHYHRPCKNGKWQKRNLLNESRRHMVKMGQVAGPIWDWVTSIKGLAAGGEAAKLLAQIDDVGKFDTISKLWAFAGFAVRDGEIDRCNKGTKSPYNRTLKSICWRIADLFVKHRTPFYRDLYDESYEDDQRKHPTPICNRCGGVGVQKGKRWVCSACGKGAGWDQKLRRYGLSYTPAHLMQRAKRKVAKRFLSHLWVKWRQFEDLPVSEPYVQAILGHTHVDGPDDATAIRVEVVRNHAAA